MAKDELKLTSKEILYKFMEQNGEIVKYMSRMDKAVEAINDNNVLHSSTLVANTNALNSITDVQKTTVRLFSFLLILLASALVIIAGAEEVFKYIQLPTL